MPYFESECEIDIEVDEFIDSCNSREIKRIIKILKEDGHLSNVTPLIPDGKRTIMDDEWIRTLEKLSAIRLTMDNDDIETIKKISNKY